MILRFVLLSLLVSTVFAQEWKPLFNGKDLDGWEVRGDGQWTVMADGTVLGQRTGDYRKMLAPGGPLQDPKEYGVWVNNQAWLYTLRNDFAEFDLHVEYWTKTHGNSGVSIRDTSRAQYAISHPMIFDKTPSHIGYEIQINNRYPDPKPSGSIYNFASAPKDAQHDDDWNSMEISSRNDMITVHLNDRLVAQHPGDPKRSRTGPIGLQLHDQFSIVMFRNIKIREIK